jgi:hypothetical protein
MTRKFCSLFLSGLLMLALTACAHPPFYSAKEIRGQIVDDATGEPLEGVIIVAQWEFYQVGLGDGGHKGQMANVIEAVTDSTGNYFMPSWGPHPRLPFNYLDNSDPKLSIFKIGYFPQVLFNPLVSEEHLNRDSLRTSQWDGKKIKMRKFEGSLEDYASRLNSFYDGLIGDRMSNYEWKKYPQMAKAVYAEYRQLKAKGLRVYRPSLPYVEEFVDPKP